MRNNNNKIEIGAFLINFNLLVLLSILRNYCMLHWKDVQIWALPYILTNSALDPDLDVDYSNINYRNNFRNSVFGFDFLFLKSSWRRFAQTAYYGICHDEWCSLKDMFF